MTKVEIKTKDGNKQVTETIEIQEMGIIQIKNFSKEINRLVKDINGNEHLRNAIDTYFKKRTEILEENKKAYEKAVAEGQENVQQVPEGEAFRQVGAQFYNDVLGSFEILLENAPETLQNLVAIASKIDYDVLSEQDIYSFLDIVDAVIEVNDIPRLVERLKKSKDSFTTVIRAIFPKKE